MNIVYIDKNTNEVAILSYSNKLSCNRWVVRSLDVYLSSEANRKELRRICNHLEIARTISTLSYCKRAKVGCVIVKDGMIISQGYNGTISGYKNVCECDGKTSEYVLHAESNAIAKIAMSNNSSKAADMYITLSPCAECLKLAVQCGIKNIYFSSIYRLNSHLRYNMEIECNLFYINTKIMNTYGY